MSGENENDEFSAENPFQSSDESTEEEFSLDQLRQAYAKVLQEQRAQGGDAPAPTEEEQDESAVEASTIADPHPQDQDETDDLLDDAPCQVSPESILEAVLFVGTPQGEKLTAQKIAALMRDVSPKEVKSLIKQLNAKYKEEGAAYRIVQDKTAYRMQLAEEFNSVKEKFYGEIRVAKLSQPAVDVLAIVAYHQPVSRDNVDKIRIRPSGSILNQLVRRQLLDIQVTETKPKTRMYVTTDRFLELFGLQGLDDLPQSHEVGSLDDLAS